MASKTYCLGFAEWNGNKYRSKQVKISQGTRNKSVSADALVGMRKDRQNDGNKDVQAVVCGMEWQSIEASPNQRSNKKQKRQK